MRTRLLLPAAPFAIVGAVQVFRLALPHQAAAQSTPVIPERCVNDAD